MPQRDKLPKAARAFRLEFVLQYSVAMLAHDFICAIIAGLKYNRRFIHGGILTVLLLSVIANSQTNSRVVYEVDSTIQTNRNIGRGYAFKQGDIASGSCPRPVIDGTPIAGGSWQADIKNAWADGSVKFAIVNFTQTLTSAQHPTLTFQAGTCNNSGALTQAQMAAFNSSNWDFQIVTTPSTGSPVTRSAKTMLAASDPASNTYGDCLNDYWLKGPVVTAVIVQDCTSASSQDFGWAWNGSVMGTAAASPNSTTASLHPSFILYFYPASNEVLGESVIENDWSNRGQDQNIALVFKAGTGPTTIYSKSTFTMITGARAHKMMWSNADGSAISGDWNGGVWGHIRIDPGMSYFNATKFFPKYDLTQTVSPDSPATSDASDGITPYSTWNGTDKGDIGGAGGFQAMTQDYSSNAEGAPIQREDLLYLYNGTTCGTAGGFCAKAVNELTGFVDATATLTGIAGGAGAWNNLGNVPFHQREGRTAATGQQSAGTNFFYCSGFDDKNALGNSTTCAGSGATNVATGKPLSRHAHSDLQWAFFPIVGTVTTGGWTVSDCSHWLDYSYFAYLSTGSPYYLEEEQMAASFCASNVNAGHEWFQSNGFFGFPNPISGINRTPAWALQVIGRAAFISPDSTPEASYYLSMMKSALEVQEGAMNITGTALTPTSTNPTCTGFDYGAANRWDWGRCSVVSTCTTGACTAIATPLHATGNAQCPTEVPLLIDTTKSSGDYAPWMYSFFSIATSELRRMGYSQATGVSTSLQQALEEQVLDTNYVPWLVGTYRQPVKNGSQAGGCNTLLTDPFFTTYTAQKAAYTATQQAVVTFDSGTPGGNFPCSAHAYSLDARAASAITQEFGTSSTDASCPSGTCTAAAAYTWLDGHVPYFGKAVSGSTQLCTGLDVQIKYALTPDSPVTGSGSTIQGSIFKGSILTLLEK